MEDGVELGRDIPVLRDYAFVADGFRGALVGPGGEYVWLCFPAWHDPAVFGQLIGSGGGYVVQPRHRYVWGGHYEEGSLIWHSRWVTNEGIVECREALALPADPHRVVVLRQLVGLAGDVAVDVALDVRSDYGRSRLNRWKEDGASWTASKGPVHARWTGVADMAVCPTDDGHCLAQSLHVAEGDRLDLVLELATTGFADPPPDAAASWAATSRSWMALVPTTLDLPGERDVRQSLAVLHGVKSASGALVAAATMSLPERARRGRNYDYRYAWIRDCCYAGHGFASVGDVDGLSDVVGYVVARLLDDGPRLRPAYLVGGGPVPSEERLELPGYPGGTDVAGNRAGDQFQLDAFGEVLLLLAAADELDCLDPDGWEAARVAATAIEARWDEADAGVWEIEPAWWTHSRLICAAGLQRIGRQPAASGPWANGVLALADGLTAAAARVATHPSGRWQRAPGDARVDAALLAVVARSPSPDDPRMSGVVDAVVANLVEDGYVYRYRAGSLPLGNAEGAFLVCSHLLTLAGLRTGRRELAVRTYERARAACGPAGLYSEEFDAGERQLRGNLPQTFVHGLLIEAAAAQAEGR